MKLIVDNTRMDTPTPVTVNDILDRFVSDSLSSRAPRTQKDYVRHIAVLRREFGHRIANELRPKDFGPFLEVTKGKIQRVRQLAVLSAAFTDAVSRFHVLDRNCLKDVKRPRNKPRDRLILDDEFVQCKALAPKRLQLAMMLALFTGQRQGDIIKFRWCDIKDNCLHLRQRKGGKRLAIEISPDLARVLDACWRLERGGHLGSAYIIPTRSGQPYTSEGFRACWQRLQRQWHSQGGSRFCFHDIRAMAATKCATPELAQRLLGHSSLSLTLAVYRRGIEKVRALSLRDQTAA